MLKYFYLTLAKACQTQKDEERRHQNWGLIWKTLEQSMLFTTGMLWISLDTASFSIINRFPSFYLVF